MLPDNFGRSSFLQCVSLISQLSDILSIWSLRTIPRIHNSGHAKLSLPRYRSPAHSHSKPASQRYYHTGHPHTHYARVNPFFSSLTTVEHLRIASCNLSFETPQQVPQFSLEPVLHHSHLPHRSQTLFKHAILVFDVNINSMSYESEFVCVRWVSSRILRWNVRFLCAAITLSHCLNSFQECCICIAKMI